MKLKADLNIHIINTSKRKCLVTMLKTLPRREGFHIAKAINVQTCQWAHVNNYKAVLLIMKAPLFRSRS